MQNNKHYAYYSPFKMVDNEGVEYILKVEQDDIAESPREWDNVCTMVCFHNRYDLGDKHDYDDGDEFFTYILCEICGMDEDDIEELSTREKYRLANESDKVYFKDLNLYDHSGLTISTSSGYPYNDYWDAGCVGWIYVSKERIFKECMGITEENWQERADKILEGEVETYDQYLKGEVYGFVLTKKIIEQEKCPHCGEIIREWEDEDEVDSCWGFYGDCLEENGILDNVSSLKFIEKE